MLEHFANTIVDLGRALEVLVGTNLLADIFGLVRVLDVLAEYRAAETYLLSSHRCL